MKLKILSVLLITLGALNAFAGDLIDNGDGINAGDLLSNNGDLVNVYTMNGEKAGQMVDETNCSFIGADYGDGSAYYGTGETSSRGFQVTDELCLSVEAKLGKKADLYYKIVYVGSRTLCAEYPRTGQ